MAIYLWDPVQTLPLALSSCFISLWPQTFKSAQLLAFYKQPSENTQITHEDLLPGSKEPTNTRSIILADNPCVPHEYREKSVPVCIVV